MPTLPNRQQQIVIIHAVFIRRVVELGQDPAQRPELEKVLETASANGWGALVGAVRRILRGQRDTSVLNGLDEEDSAIAEAILRGLQNPATLPDPNMTPDPSLAAPGLAGMIHAAARGDAKALKIVSEMAEQMSRAGGSMARLAALVRPLLNGERDPDKLCRGLDTRTEQLVLEILAQLRKSELH